MRKKIFNIMYLSLLGVLLLNGMGMLNMANAAEITSKKALIIVDPGFSKFSLQVARQMEEKLTAKGFEVKLTPVKKFKEQDLTAIDLLVLGGPTYAAQPSGALKKILSKLQIASKVKTLIYQTGGADCGGLEPLKKSVEAQGLIVAGSAGFLAKPDSEKEVSSKIDELVGKI